MTSAPAEPARPTLEALSRVPRRRRGRFWLWLVIVLAALGGAGAWWQNRPAAPVVYETKPAALQDLIVTVIATGTVQPTTRVDISSELSGTLAAVEVDFNDTVTEGQVLARLDDTKLKAQVSNAEAQLASARAKLTQAQATSLETAEALAQAKALDERGLSARASINAATAAHDRALASVEMAKADVSIAEANLELEKADLAKAVIRSPINGIVLSRTAEKGQIVAATLNAPILFILAEDLTRMELQVSVDEADIGRVAVGQEASFTVDAFPGQRFDALITQIRYAPDETADVVSYTAVLSVSNDALLLRPGMTATAEITVSKEVGALVVPVAALRYAPPSTESTSRAGRGLLGYIMPRRPQATGGGKVDGSGLWVLRDGAPVRVAITPGATDGTTIAVTSEDLREGDEVILSQSTAG